MVVPVQAISRGGSTTWRVEVRELDPAFHRKTVPGWTGPWSSIDLMSGFQDGHWSTAEITANTVPRSGELGWLPIRAARSQCPAGRMLRLTRNRLSGS